MPTPAFGVFDLETTGIDPATARIVTAYVGAIDADGAVIDGREWMIAPDGFEIPEGAANIHGITTEYALEHGRAFADVLAEVVAALGAMTVPVVGHNVSYDFTLLAHEMHRAGHPDPVGFVDGIDIVDTLLLDKALDKWRRGARTLSALAPLHGVVLTAEEAHGAAADAIAAGRIALKLTAAYPALGNLDAAGLRRLQKGWAREQRASYVEYRRRTDPDFATDLNWPLYTTALELARSVETPVF